MSSMEMIHVRLTEESRAWVLQALSEHVGNIQFSGPEQDLLQVRLFVHAAVESDLCLRLLWGLELPPNGSAVGSRIAAGLETVGIVEHTVWLEFPTDETNPISR